LTDSQFSLGVAPDSSPEEGLSLALALVTSAKDTHPIPQVWSFQTLVEVFSTPQGRAHKDGPAWIPATFGGAVNSRGGLRHSENVLCLHALVLDIDKTPYTAEALKVRLEGYTYLCHTTYSHTPAHPRWRVILPLAYPIPPTQLKDALLNTSNELDLQCDTTCTDPARLFFLPSCPAHHREHYQVILGRGQGFKANVAAFKPQPHNPTTPQRKGWLRRCRFPREQKSNLSSLIKH
jgi:putative DNA primase/helicase